MDLDWPEDVDRWLTDAEKSGGRVLDVAVALLSVLGDLDEPPRQESATVLRLRGTEGVGVSGVWCVRHPFVGTRLVCAFPDARTAIVTAALNGKPGGGTGAGTGDDGVPAATAASGGALVDAWVRQHGRYVVPEEVHFVRGADRVRALSERPDVAEGLARSRAAMDDADRAQAMGLAAVRQAARLTAEELARKPAGGRGGRLAVDPGGRLLGTLNSYLEAVGGHARLVVRFDDDREVGLDLGDLD